MTTLRSARRRGVEVVTRFHAHDLEVRRDEVTVRGHRDGKGLELHGRHVVLAAGAMGTPPLLFRSGYGKRIPGLGRHFTCHPQFMACARLDAVVDAHRGFFQSVGCSDSRFEERGFKFETNFMPPIIFSMLFGGAGGSVYDMIGDYRRMACLEISIRDDDEPGAIRPRHGGGTVIDRPLGASHRDKLADATQVVHECFVQMGATDTWFCPRAFSVHPMGGCTLGSDPADAAVDESFHLFGEERVYVCDSSTFPNAPGRNPSLTVMALALRASEVMLREA
ncbi:MAG: hypothetical protein CME04_10315 [Gemmatimonadaceae bacterium]|nr:hypothetical protein [Gemmatimonadaceae bacterium]